IRSWCTLVALAGLFGGIGTSSYQAAEREPVKEVATFGVLRGPSLEAARAQPQEWLKSVGKTDQATSQAFEALWSQTDRPVLDLVADTFALGNPEVKKVLDEARDINA